MGAFSLIVVINLLNRLKMSQQFVTILMPNGHREKVKVTPGTIIQPLFADLLKKHGFKAADFSLKSSTGKPVDVSVPFRLTGIANRATLESCQKNKSDTSSASASSSIVQVAIQMPDGVREVVKIEDDCPLWDIIEHLIDKMPHLLDDDDLGGQKCSFPICHFKTVLCNAFLHCDKASWTRKTIFYNKS